MWGFKLGVTSVLGRGDLQRVYKGHFFPWCLKHIFVARRRVGTEAEVHLGQWFPALAAPSETLGSCDRRRCPSHTPDQLKENLLGGARGSAFSKLPRWWQCAGDAKTGALGSPESG